MLHGDADWYVSRMRELTRTADLEDTGLTLRVRLLRALPDRFKVDIKVKEGTHQSERSVNKVRPCHARRNRGSGSTTGQQLNDKERVAAALENEHLLNVVHQCLATAGRRGRTADEP